MYRQGDILLIERERIPEGAIRVYTDVLVEGEVTGHKHRICGSAQVYQLRDRLFVQVEQSAKLIHEEHEPLNIERGIYEVIREREYNPFEAAIRQVCD
jgi:hypothetical protein